jgi:hypothetical protein
MDPARPQHSQDLFDDLPVVFMILGDLSNEVQHRARSTHGFILSLADALARAMPCPRGTLLGEVGMWVVTMNLRIPVRPANLFPSGALPVQRRYERVLTFLVALRQFSRTEIFLIRNSYFEKKRRDLVRCAPGRVAVRRSLRFRPRGVGRSDWLRRGHPVGPGAGCPGGARQAV